MLYLVNWIRDKHMIKDGAKIIEARSTYDAKAKFLRTNWRTERMPMSVAIQLVKAKCLEDERFAFPLSKESLKDPNRAYEALRVAGAKLRQP